MWLSRPVYELLPYAWMVLGTLLLGSSYWFNASPWSSLLLLGALVALVIGLVLWLRRRGYRKQQSEYNSRSLDD